MFQKLDERILAKVAVVIQKDREKTNKQIADLKESLAKQPHRFYDDLVVLAGGTDLTDNEKAYMAQLAESDKLPVILRKFILGICSSIRKSTDTHDVARKDGAMLAYEIFLTQLEKHRKVEDFDNVTGEPLK